MMKLSGENMIRIGLMVGGLILGTGGTLGTQSFTTPAPPKAKPAPVEAEVGCLEIRIPLDQVKFDKVKQTKRK